MAGLITRDTIDKVRQSADLKIVVEEYVTLKTAGVGSFKGLCPFHDERTPSFHIRPAVGTYHCFGCEASGDVFSFLMEMEHTSFTETVERLAARFGIQVIYEEGQGPDRREQGQRQRMLQAHQIADEFFQEALTTTQARLGQQFLQERGFTFDDAKHFGVGYAPDGWNHLRDHLRSRGFVDEELRVSGLFSEGSRGLYDRFRGRLTWPIRDMTGSTIGFGARRLSEEDKGPKYLNTPETPLYKKSQVLYGIDLAKRAISKSRQLVVVEGYTDVMAAHLAGITTAVATCGTAFGSGHIKIARRLIADDGTGGEVIFTFDGDEAGQKAALRAFEEDDQFLAQTFVAVEPSGMDPCDLRQHRGDQAVVDLIASRKPLFEFALTAGLKNFDLNTVEGQSGALRHAAPIISGIRDEVIRNGYMRKLAGWLGMPLEFVQRAVQSQPRNSAIQSRNPRSHDAPPQPTTYRPDYGDPVTRLEKEALEVVIQHPETLSAEQWQTFYQAKFRVPALATIHAAVIAAGSSGVGLESWVEKITDEVPNMLAPLVAELAVTPLPVADEEGVVFYCQDIMNRLFEIQITHRKAELSGQLQRLGEDSDPAEFSRINSEIMELERRRRNLRAQALRFDR